MEIKNKLWELRKEIPLGSLYIRDYENSIGIPADICCNFFDGYVDYLEEMLKENGYYSDDMFFELVPSVDNEDNLEAWYYCCEINLFDGNGDVIMENTENTLHVLTVIKESFHSTELEVENYIFTTKQQGESFIEKMIMEYCDNDFEDYEEMMEELESVGFAEYDDGKLFIHQSQTKIESEVF